MVSSSPWFKASPFVLFLGFWSSVVVVCREAFSLDYLIFALLFRVLFMLLNVLSFAFE